MKHRSKVAANRRTEMAKANVKMLKDPSVLHSEGSLDLLLTRGVIKDYHRVFVTQSCSLPSSCELRQQDEAPPPARHSPFWGFGVVALGL